MKAYWELSPEEIIREFHVAEQGLSDTQAEEIRREKGENLLQEGKRRVSRKYFSGSLGTFW